MAVLRPDDVEGFDPVPGSPLFEAAIERIGRLAALGCDILRFAVPDKDVAEALGALAGRSLLPLVADIHFDWRLALRCLDFPIAKIRINPGNIERLLEGLPRSPPRPRPGPIRSV